LEGEIETRTVRVFHGFYHEADCQDANQCEITTTDVASLATLSSATPVLDIPGSKYTLDIVGSGI
jgi:hypothetical protein